MPGRFFLTRSMSELQRIAGVETSAVADSPARFNISPGQSIITLTAAGFELMRWGIIPVGRVNSRGRPCHGNHRKCAIGNGFSEICV